MALIHCTNCGATISDKAPNCPKCGTAIAKPVIPTPTPTPASAPVFTPQQPQPPQQQPQQYNTPSQYYQQPAQPNNNNAVQPPSNINNWNWGAFSFGWLWGAFNGVYWPLFMFLLVLIPYVGFFLLGLAGLVVAIILGISGNKMAWQNREWRDALHFKFAQRNWNIAAAIYWGWILFTVITVVYYMIAFASKMNDTLRFMDEFM